MSLPAASVPDAPRPRRRLFWKYVVVVVALVTTVLVAAGGVELWFSYQESKDALVALQREKAGAAAARIEAFIREIERQMGWTTLPLLASGSAALEQRRIDFVRLQRQVPAITDLSYLDAEGKEQLRVSRLAMDVAGSGTDLSADPRFTEAIARRVYHGPVTFRKESEPYMVVAMAQSGGGVTVAEVNLKFIWDVVTQIKIGKAGRAYVVDENGNLIAHPDISLVLQKTSLSALPQVREALAGGVATPTTRDVQGRSVLTAHATIPGLRWIVFAEQPLDEALAPIEGSVKRSLLLLAVGVALAMGASLVLARRMVRPIQALQVGAARIGGGELGHRIDIRTGDELETLARDFNLMTATLQESYATLEQRVEDRTRELSEALEQQTATAEILRVISSSPTDIQPVLEVVAQKAAQVCDASDALIRRVEGEVMTQAAHFGEVPVNPSETRALTRDSVSGRAILERRTIHLHNLLDPEFAREYPEGAALQRQAGYRTIVATPLLREGNAVGVMMIRRMNPDPFTDKQIALLETFANQAVIAIENVRLFTELQQRNAEVTEALEQQTATGEILRVISRSPSDLTPVFQTIAQSAARLCDASFGGVIRVEDGVLVPVAIVNEDPAQRQFIRESFPLPVDRGGAIGQAVNERRVAHVHDFLVEHGEDDYLFTAGQPLFGYRTILVVPMLRDDTAIGGIVLWRTEPRPFTDKQIAVVRTFADQGVIAIENVRLFRELELRNADLTETLEQQTATGEILSVISSSPTDVQPVLDVVAKNATRVCGAMDAIIFRVEGEHARRVAHFGSLPLAAAGVPPPMRAISPGSVVGRAVLGRRTIQVADMLAENVAEEFPEGVDLSHRSGHRTVMATPLVREGVAIGAILMRRDEVRPFSGKQVALLESFADQAVIAIENVRLFTELQARTAQLQVANRHKDEFLANMSHELRTPLNAIIGFSEVMLERMSGDINEKQEEYLGDILSSGRHLLSLINDILDLSKIEAGRMELDLADFNLPAAIDNALTLVRERAARRGLVLAPDVDAQLGDFRGDERKIKQVLLNLLSNAIKFTPEGGRVGVRAVLKGDVVEIAVSDTGVGIAQEDQETVFEEFRQVGTDVARKHEGTGLGLALARRFVELHGGNIWLESEVGVGSTFTFALPVRS